MTGSMLMYSYEILGMVKIMEIDSAIVASSTGEGEGNGKLLGIELHVYKMKNIMEMDDGDGCTA